MKRALPFLALAACGHPSSPRPIDNGAVPFTIPALVAWMFEPEASWRFRVVTSTRAFETDQTTASPATEGGCASADVRRFEHSAASRIECHDLGGAERLVAEVWLVDERGLWQVASDAMPDADPGRDDGVAWLELAIPPLERDETEELEEGSISTHVRRGDGGAWCWGSESSAMGSQGSDELCIDEDGIVRGETYTGGDDTEVTVTFTRE
jgi:hypothetical protein